MSKPEVIKISDLSTEVVSGPPDKDDYFLGETTTGSLYKIKNSVLLGNKQTSRKMLQTDGDFNNWWEGTSISIAGYGGPSAWKFALNAGAGSLSQVTHASIGNPNNSKPYLARIDITSSGASNGIYQISNGNIYSGKQIVVLIKAKYTSSPPSSIAVQVADSTLSTGYGLDTIAGFTTDFAWYIARFTVTANAETSLALSIRNLNDQIWDLDIDAVHAVVSNDMLVGLTPSWLTEYEDKIEMIDKLEADFEALEAGSTLTGFGHGFAPTMTDASIALHYKKKNREPTISLSSAANFRISDDLASQVVTGIFNQENGLSSARVRFSVAAGLVVKEPYFIRANATAAAKIFVDSRL